MALIENMAGVEECRATARTSPLLCALAFGAEDYITDIGGRRTPTGNEVLYALKGRVGRTGGGPAGTRPSGGGYPQ